MKLYKNKCGYVSFSFVVLSLIWIHSNAYGARSSATLTVSVLDKVQAETLLPSARTSGGELKGIFEIRNPDKNGIATLLYRIEDGRSVSSLAAEVYSLSGQTVVKTVSFLLCGEFYKFDTSELLPGIYIMKISTGGTKLFAGNFFVSK